MSPAAGFFLFAALTPVFAGVIHRLIRGPNISGENSRMVLERAIKRRDGSGTIAGILFFAASAVKLLAHLGWITAQMKGALVPVVGIPLLLALAAYGKARWDIRAANAAIARSSGAVAV